MKASRNTSQPSATSARFEPHPLTIEQENAIHWLLQGKSDQEVGEIIGRDRSTIFKWKTRLPMFAATLESRRQEQFGQASQQLRNLLAKAIQNVAAAVEEGNLKASFEVIRTSGLQHFAPPSGETDVGRIADRLCLEMLRNESIPERSFDLSHLDRNPAYEARKNEILESLGRTDVIS
jgi:DNA-binding CsgD family transcriptional regulator